MEPVQFDMGEGRMFKGWTGVSLIHQYLEHLKMHDLETQGIQLKEIQAKVCRRLNEMYGFDRHTVYDRICGAIESLNEYVDDLKKEDHYGNFELHARLHAVALSLGEAKSQFEKCEPITVNVN